MLRRRLRDRLNTGLRCAAVVVGVLCMGVGLLTGQSLPGVAGAWLVALIAFVRLLSDAAP